MPMMSSKTLFLMISEKKNISAVTAIAPAKAATNTAIKPDTENKTVDTLPPKSSITSATPKPAPALIPNTSGPANGFRKAVCSIKPLTASAPPQNIAVIACGKRFPKTMKRQLSLPSNRPKKISTMSLNGMRTEPI